MISRTKGPREGACGVRICTDLHPRMKLEGPMNIKRGYSRDLRDDSYSYKNDIRLGGCANPREGWGFASYGIRVKTLFTDSKQRKY
jgi:hypothetical protein